MNENKKVSDKNFHNNRGSFKEGTKVWFTMENADMWGGDRSGILIKIDGEWKIQTKGSGIIGIGGWLEAYPNSIFPCTPVEAKEEEKCSSSSHCSHNTNGRDRDKPCSIQFPAPRPTEGWEDRLVNSWTGTPCRGIVMHELEFLHTFIATELAKKDEEYERCLYEDIANVDHGWIKYLSSYHAKLREWVKDNTIISDMIHKSALLQFLDQEDKPNPPRE